MYLYVIAETKRGPCKIGFAANPEQRLSLLQCGNPRKLVLEYKREVTGIHDANAVERMAHAHAGERNRLVGEWFDLAVYGAIACVDLAIDDVDATVT